MIDTIKILGSLFGNGALPQESGNSVLTNTLGAALGPTPEELAEIARIAEEKRLAEEASLACQKSINTIMEGKKYFLLLLVQPLIGCWHTEMNMKLTQNRAQSVQSHLKNQNNGQSIISSSRGYGETNSIANNNSVSGRKLN